MAYVTSYALSNPLISDEYSVFHPVKATDFGVLQPGANGTVIDGGFGAGNLAYNAGAGSLASSTANCKISYVTAQGESLPSGNFTVSIAASSGAFTITFPALPSATSGSPELNAAPILGFRVYSASSATTLLNAGTDFDATTQALLKSIVTTAGTIANVIPAGTATAQVKVYGSGAAVPAVNQSGIQQPLPVLAASASVDYFLMVKYGFLSQKLVEWARPNSSSDPAGLLISSADCIAPVWQASTAISLYQGSAPANSSFVMINGFLFACTTAGTTGSSAPNFAGNLVKGNTVADNSAVWTCLGQRGLVRIRFTNTNTGSSGSPVAQDYWFAQL